MRQPILPLPAFTLLTVSDPYGVSPVTDPLGPLVGTRRALRGGPVDQNVVHARSANRLNSIPSTGGSTIYYGFRLARTQ